MENETDGNEDFNWTSRLERVKKKLFIDKEKSKLLEKLFKTKPNTAQELLNEFFPKFVKHIQEYEQLKTEFDHLHEPEPKLGHSIKQHPESDHIPLKKVQDCP